MTRFLLLALFLFAPLVARADLFTFVLTGASSDNFSIDSTKPLLFSSGHLFGVRDQSLATHQFFELSQSGGYDNFAGPQLFSGPTSSPTFLTGTFALTLGSTGPAAQLVVTDTSLAVAPEPSSMLLLATGLAGVAGIARRRLLR